MFSKYWHPLVAFLIIAGIGFLISLFLMWADPRQLLGAPLWLQSVKLWVAFGLLGASLIFVLSFVAKVHLARAKLLAILSAILSLAAVACADIQLLRGQRLHFNFSTPFDKLMFLLSAIAIHLLWLVFVYITALLWTAKIREAHADAPESLFRLRAARWAMIHLSLCSLLANYMSIPSAEQLLLAKYKIMTYLGSAFVGMPDGHGQLMPLTAWSAEVGDMRASHFVAVHGVEVILLFALLSLFRKKISLQVLNWRLNFLIANLFLLFFLFFLQALGGQSVANPHSPYFWPILSALASISLIVVGSVAEELFGSSLAHFSHSPHLNPD